MNKILLFIFLMLSISAFSQEPTWLWAKNASGTDNDLSYAVKADDLGNVYACGLFYSPTISFGNITLVKGSANNTKAFLVKYDANGAVQWAVAPNGESSAFDLTIDGEGNVYVCGSIGSSTSFGSHLLTCSGNSDGFIAKYNTSGNVIWAKNMGGSNTDFYYCIESDPFGNIILGGHYASPIVNFGNTSITNLDDVYDLFIVSYDTGGNFNWVKKFGALCDSRLNDIACDVSGNIAVAGSYFSSTIYFDSLSAPNAGHRDAFVALYNNMGNVLWAKGVGSSEEDIGATVAFDQNGNVIFGGVFESQGITIDTYYLANSGISNSFMVSYNSLGSVNWAKKGTSAEEGIIKICTDTLGNIYTLGNYDNPYIFWNVDSVYNNGMYDLLLSKFDASGNILWAKTTGSDGDDAATSFSIDKSGNLYITGWYKSNLLYLDANFLYNLGYADFYVGKLAFSATGISAVNLVNELNVYPNPSYDNIFVKTNITSPDKSLFLYDMYGRVLREILVTSNITEIERGELPSGMYILEIHEKNIVKERQKIIFR